MVVVPAATPVTIPVLLTVAAAVLVDDHVPPVATSERVVDAVPQTDRVPVITPATGSGLSVTTLVAAAVPQLLVTV